MFTINWAGILDVLATQELLMGVFLVGAGLVFMLFGFKVYRPLVAISFGVLGFVLFSLLPVAEEMRLASAFLGALGLGAASTLMVRGATITLAGAWGGIGGLMLVSQFDLPVEAALSLTAIAAVCAASMTFILYRETIALILSLEGSMLLIGGMVIFANQSPVLWIHIRDMLLHNSVFGPFVVMSGTVAGLYWQLAELRQVSAGTTA